jgi:hypothetical protein
VLFTHSITHLEKNTPSMCQIHTETLFFKCAHSGFTQTRTRHCDCRRDVLGMDVDLEQKCPYCRESKDTPEEDGSANPDLVLTEMAKKTTHLETARVWLTKEKFADTVDWLRRVQDFTNAQVAVEKSGQTVLDYELRISWVGDPCLKQSNDWSATALWRNQTDPLDLQPNKFLIDKCKFISPEMKVVPPGKIPHEHGKCPICWGSFAVTSGGEACSGGSPRMLPCGHIFGQRCIARAFETSNSCPYCREEYRVLLVQRSSRLTYYAVSLEGLLKNNEWNSGLGSKLKYLVILCVWPFLLAVVTSMKVAPKINVFSESQHVFRTAPKWQRFLYAIAVMASSPLMYLFMLYARVFGIPLWAIEEQFVVVLHED